jgi:hypothetical protein
MTLPPIRENALDTQKQPKYPQNGPKWAKYAQNGSKMGEICRIYPLPIILSRKNRGMGRGYYLRGKLDPGKIILVSFGPKNCR